MRTQPSQKPPFALEAFEANQSEILLRMGDFSLDTCTA